MLTTDDRNRRAEGQSPQSKNNEWGRLRGLWPMEERPEPKQAGAGKWASQAGLKPSGRLHTQVEPC
eukprot:10215657-Alexandrium_andersonii.AAC.1